MDPGEWFGWLVTPTLGKPTKRYLQGIQLTETEGENLRSAPNRAMHITKSYFKARNIAFLAVVVTVVVVDFYT